MSVAQKPNILFVFADQHRAVSTGCYGNQDVITPNIDRLSESGARALNAISNSPLCCPYRASLMTGRYAHTVGMPTNYQTLNFDGKFLAEALRDAGYQTGYIGKFHLYFPTGDRSEDEKENGFVPRDKRCGFLDYWRGINDGHQYYDWFYYEDDNPEPINSKRFQPDVQAEQAIDFIRTRGQGGSPWCLFLSFAPPHPPFATPDEYIRHYPNAAIPKNVKDGAPYQYAQKNVAKYYGLIEAVDWNFGRILDELRQQGLDDNTIVVYTADHGEMLGGQGYMGHKRWPFDESVRVPFVIRWPGHIPAGREIRKPLSAIDIMPTLLGLAGLSPQHPTDGRSAASAFLDGDESGMDEFSYCTMHYSYVPWPGWKAVRSERYLYAEAHGKPWLFYDRASDPLEMNNLIDNPDYADIQSSLKKTLERKMESARDSWDYRLDTGDYGDYKDSDAPKVKDNYLGYPWPGMPNKLA
ncbi:MAG: sulfatase [Planctomycetota bacterium]